MKSVIKHDGLIYYHFACLSDFAGNYSQPGIWADLWIPEQNDWHSVIQEIVKKIRLDTPKSKYYSVLSETLDSFYLEKIKHCSFIVTMGGCWSWYAPNKEVAKKIEKMNHVFLNDTSLVKALLKDDHQKVFDILSKKVDNQMTCDIVVENENSQDKTL